MVSSLPFSWRTVHEGVMRRSAPRVGVLSAVGPEPGTEIMTGTSIGVGWKDILGSQYYPFINY